MSVHEKFKFLKQDWFRPSVKDALSTSVLLSMATAICLVLRFVDHTAAYASMIFILTVFLISRNTQGYFYGMLSSFVSVLLVNFIFTYPYFEFNFTLSGYPVTIVCMLVVAITTSTLTTQIKKQEEMHIEAEREKMRGNLLRAVSHDLRTPLTSILGASSVMIENEAYLTREERLKLLYGMKEDSQWLIRMVENLLSITRIHGEGEREAKITKQPEIVEEVVAASITKFKKRFPDFVIHCEVPRELLIIPMDAMLIQQVLVNLLENVAIHSESATTIKCVVTKEEGYSVFSVSDNGKGISETVLPHIFEGYFNSQYEKVGDRKRNMGIGLSVCNTIIKAHHGTMMAENIKGGGACFTFRLPV